MIKKLKVNFKSQIVKENLKKLSPRTDVRLICIRPCTRWVKSKGSVHAGVDGRQHGWYEARARAPHYTCHAVALGGYLYPRVMAKSQTKKLKNS